MVKKIVFLSLIISAAAVIVFAQEETATIAPEETVTVEDLGVSEPKVLPTSPFYFFKEMGRSLQGFITFNPVSKAELQLKIANEKAAELKQVSKTQPQNAVAIQKALENYQKSQGKLRERLEKLSETSQNPKIDTLLNNLTDKVVKHEKLFDEIAIKFKDKEQISNMINSTMSGSESIMGEASKKDDPAKFSSRLEKVLLEEKGGDLKNVRSVEIIDRLSNKTTPEIKESLGRLREEFSKKLERDIQNLVENKGEDALKEKIASTPGDAAARSVIIEEIQKRAEKQLSETLEKAMGQIEKVLQKERDINQKAKEQIERAEKMIQEVKVEKSTSVASTLLTEARDHLANAKAAFEQEQYGEAFGQARSAEVLARNALRFFDQEKPETGNFKQQLKELEEKISIYKNLIEKRELTQEQKENAYEILENNAVMQLEQARLSLANEDLEKTKTYIDYIKRTFLKLSNILENKTTSAAPQAQQIQQIKTAPAQAMPVALNCENIQKKIIALKESLASGRIDESSFKTDYDANLRELIVCQNAKNAQTPTARPAPEKPTVLPMPVSPTPVSPTPTETEKLEPAKPTEPTSTVKPIEPIQIKSISPLQ